MSRSRLIVSFAALIGATVAASAPAHAWKCCDQWGYDFPGTYWTQNGCENAGGVVESGLVCPNFTFPFKCCDADGAPIPGVYGTPHQCKMAGHEVFSGVLCPESGPFQCCDPEGGSAPGVYAFRYNCVADGYVVQDFSFQGCPGGWIDRAQEFFSSVKHAKSCSTATNKAYNKTDVDPDTAGKQTVTGQWQDAYEDAGAPYGPWTDKDDHCITSCLITVECGKPAAALAGWARETLQMCDGKPFNAWGWGDECANRIGRDYGATLDDSGAYAEACRDHCTQIADLESQCAGTVGGLTGAVTTFTAPFGLDPKEILAATMEGLQAELGSVWERIENKCNDLLGGLTYPNAASQLAETLHEMKTQGLALIDAFGPLAPEAIGNYVSDEVGGDVTAGALVQDLGDGRTMVLLDLPASEVDAYLTFDAGELAEMELRGADGNTLAMSASTPVTVACSTPPCERRVGWSQWTVLREPTEPVGP